MGRVKDILIDGYEANIDLNNLYKIEITTIDGSLYTISKDELDIINDSYIQHGVNGDYISYSGITQLHKGQEIKQVVFVKQIFIKHIVAIEVFYNCTQMPYI